MSNDSCCKVGAVTESRNLSAITATGDVDEYLVTRWLGRDGYSEAGVRTLADWFNKTVMREVYTEHGRSVIDARIESEYEALSGGEDSERADLVSDLAIDGIDGPQLIDDFVSKSTMRRHLRNCLDVEKPTATGTDSNTNWEATKVEYARDTVRANVEDALRSLDNKDRLAGADDVEVSIPVFLSCPECPVKVRFDEALDRGYVCEEHLGAPREET